MSTEPSQDYSADILPYLNTHEKILWKPGRGGDGIYTCSFWLQIEN